VSENSSGGTENSRDVEITLQRNDLRLRVSPFGASLRGFWRESADGQAQEIVTTYTGAKGKVGGQGDVLIPFPGRIRDGRYTFGGQTYQMPLNDKEGPNAIHGFLRLVPWEIIERDDSSVTFSAVLAPDTQPGYPFGLRATVRYSLNDDGFACRFTIENTGDRPAPVGAGFHPYFAVGTQLIDDALLHVPMVSTLEFDDGLLPTGRVLSVEGTPLDFREARPIGTTRINTCYLNPVRDADGQLCIRMVNPASGNALTVWMDPAFDYVVLYSGDPLPDAHRRRSLAIEPMTCGSDAFNYPEWGLVVLAPGQIFQGAWGVTPA
jgi:aldose 1-epimerase